MHSHIVQREKQLNKRVFINEQNKTRLIEYAAFLYKKGAELTSKLWLYAIHSDNPEMIQLLKENQVKPPNSLF